MALGMGKAGTLVKMWTPRRFLVEPPIAPRVLPSSKGRGTLYLRYMLRGRRKTMDRPLSNAFNRSIPDPRPFYPTTEKPTVGCHPNLGLEWSRCLSCDTQGLIGQ
jgi:hypothetical protein